MDVVIKLKLYGCGYGLDEIGNVVHMHKVVRSDPSGFELFHAFNPTLRAGYMARIMAELAGGGNREIASAGENISLTGRGAAVDGKPSAATKLSILA